MEHYVSTSFGISKDFCGGSTSMLAASGQGNVVLVNICRNLSCIMLKGIEKEKLGVRVKSSLKTDSVQQLAIAFVDYNDFVSDGEKETEKEENAK